MRVLFCFIQTLNQCSCPELLYSTHYITNFLQIGDADETEKLSPDEDAEKPDGIETSGVEKNNRDTEQLYQKQEEASTQVKINRCKEHFDLICLYLHILNHQIFL